MRYKKEIRKQFVRTMKKASSDVDLSMIRAKYLDWQWLFKRFYPVVLRLKEWGCNFVIDFGCGTGGLVTLANLMKVRMVGIDVPVIARGENQYNVVTSELNKMGFPIKVFDTSKYPWDFESDSVDAVTAFQSIREDYIASTERNHLSWDNEIICRRIKEISRIVKPKGIWHIGSKGHYAGLKRSAVWHSLSEKQPKIMLWSGSGLKNS